MRLSVASIAIAWLLVAPARALTELPSGFGNLHVGDRWLEPVERDGIRDLADISLPWDRFVHECGYRFLSIKTENGELLVTVNDFVVTKLSYVTPIREDSDLPAVADLVIESYGQPTSAAMRSLSGRVTIDTNEVNFITLSYDVPNAVEFAISGRSLWQYQVTVRFQQHRWHENKTYRCARQKEQSASRGG